MELGAGNWEIVGMFDSGGSAFDSEVWADASVLNGNYDRPPNIFQSATARLASVDDFEAFRAALEGDPGPPSRRSASGSTTRTSPRS